jgi:hypothetical protein
MLLGLLAPEVAGNELFHGAIVEPVGLDEKGSLSLRFSRLS